MAENYIFKRHEYKCIQPVATKYIERKHANYVTYAIPLTLQANTPTPQQKAS